MTEDATKEKGELLNEYKEATEELNRVQKEREFAEKSNNIALRVICTDKILQIELHLNSIRRRLAKFGMTF